MDVLQYTKQDTPIHRLNPVVKLFLLFCFWVVAFLSFNLFCLLMLVGICVTLWWVARLPLRSFVRLLALLSLVFAIIITINGFLYYAGKTPIFRLFRWSFTWEGLIFGLTISAKMLSVVTVVPLLTMTTPLSRFMVALVRLHLPYKFIFTLGTAIRFTPLVDQSYRDIIEAQKLRGHDLAAMGFFRRLRWGYLPIFVPLMLSLLRRASDLDVAIEARGFGAPGKRTYLEDVSLQRRDYVAIGLTLAMTVGVVVLSNLLGQATSLLVITPQGK